MSLVLSISIAKSAFTNPNLNLSVPEPIQRRPTSTTGTSTGTGTNKSFLDDLKETDRERLMRERKSALNKLFDKTNLQPIVVDVDGIGGGQVSNSSSSQSKRALLEKMEKKQKKKSGQGEGGDEEEEEEDEMSEIQLNLVCTSKTLLPTSLLFPLSWLIYTRSLDSKATKNDANLPERDPPDTFSLNLRGYQKQALKWMSSMETGEEEARKSMSMHPLWEK